MLVFDLLDHIRDTRKWLAVAGTVAIAPKGAALVFARAFECVNAYEIGRV